MSDQPIHPIQQLARALTWTAGGLLLYGVSGWLLAQPVFALREVEVATPVAHVTAAQIRLVAERQVRGNFFTVDLEQVRAAFEKLPWVREAHVTRRWPDTLVVSLIEHVALARWNDAELVNQQGEVFAAALDSAIPHFSGPENSSGEVAQAYRQYQPHLAKLGHSISELHLSPRRAWSMKLDDGTRIRLGREQPTARLLQFTQLFPKLFADPSQTPAYVDLRYADGFAIRMPAAARRVNQS
jgi:cell division protein FtsQ